MHENSSHWYAVQWVIHSFRVAEHFSFRKLYYYTLNSTSNVSLKHRQFWWRNLNPEGHVREAGFALWYEFCSRYRDTRAQYAFKISITIEGGSGQVLSIEMIKQRDSKIASIWWERLDAAEQNSLIPTFGYFYSSPLLQQIKFLSAKMFNEEHMFSSTITKFYSSGKV